MKRAVQKSQERNSKNNLFLDFIQKITHLLIVFTMSRDFKVSVTKTATCIFRSQQDCQSFIFISCQLMPLSLSLSHTHHLFFLFFPINALFLIFLFLLLLSPPPLTFTFSGSTQTTCSRLSLDQLRCFTWSWCIQLWLYLWSHVTIKKSIKS